jgi:hypothetical protein
MTRSLLPALFIVASLAGCHDHHDSVATTDGTTLMPALQEMEHQLEAQRERTLQHAAMMTVLTDLDEVSTHEHAYQSSSMDAHHALEAVAHGLGECSDHRGPPDTERLAVQLVMFDMALASHAVRTHDVTTAEELADAEAAHLQELTGVLDAMTATRNELHKGMGDHSCPADDHDASGSDGATGGDHGAGHE